MIPHTLDEVAFSSHTTGLYKNSVCVFVLLEDKRSHVLDHLGVVKTNSFTNFPPHVEMLLGVFQLHAFD